MEREVMKLSLTYYQQNGVPQLDGYHLVVVRFVLQVQLWEHLLLIPRLKQLHGMELPDLVILVDLVKEMARPYQLNSLPSLLRVKKMW